MIGLTQKQRELLAFVRAEIDRSGQVPTFEEMRRHVGLASKSGVFRLLNSLEERGHIRRLPNRTRAIELIEVNALARFSRAELMAELDRRMRGQ